MCKKINISLANLQNPRMVKILKLPKLLKVFNACLQLMAAQWNSYAKLKVHLVHKLLGSGTYLPKPKGTLISLINVTSRLPILENSTLHKTKIPPARLLISLQNFQYSYRTINILTEPNDDFSHGHFEL